MPKTTEPPDGWRDRRPSWHHAKLIEFTAMKREIGEPSPHLAIVGHMARDVSMDSRLWLLGCYAATYCLPTAQVLWERWDVERVLADPPGFESWLAGHWPGIVTRQERRCVRTPRKMAACLTSFAAWTKVEYPSLFLSQDLSARDPHAYYDFVWESVSNIAYFGRYINIRLVEGLRRYCEIPARLYDIRSLGGWSPKKCLAYLYPEHANVLLIDNRDGNLLTNDLAGHLLADVRAAIPEAEVDEYVLAAMLCEYKGAYENRHQYPGWTIDQEPPMYEKVLAYWGDDVDRDALWAARRALFPPEVLGEVGGWPGTRWPLAATLRDHGYNWTDLLYDFAATEDFAVPVPRKVLV